MTLGADEAMGHPLLSNQSHSVDENVKRVRQKGQGMLMVAGGRHGDGTGVRKPKKKHRRINIRP